MTFNRRPENNPADHQTTEQERDLLQQSIKKVRKGEEGFTGTSILTPRVEGWMLKESESDRRSYANMVRGDNSEDEIELRDSEDDDMSRKEGSQPEDIPKTENEEATDKHNNTSKSAKWWTWGKAFSTS
ncbi:uncharacterized protein DS421_5g170240 [Arachis hypogaea]|nr:uncharacterized protein DS421_5g170240 [Arachis hypogaea]